MNKQNFSNEIRTYNQLLSESLTASIDEEWLVNELREIWCLLVDFDKDQTLEKTLVCFYENNFKINETSALLNVHRNTLAYRLNKIYELTNKNPYVIKDIMILINARTVYNIK